MSEVKDLAIIGAGIAGVSAAVYAKRSGLDFFIFEPQAIGGQLILMQNIDNYVGLDLGTKAQDMVQRLTSTLTNLKINVISQKISKVLIEQKVLNLYTNNDLYSAKTLIIATGASFKKLGLKEENNFVGKGLSYCAVCDGFFFKDKAVAVVGGGNTAVEEALYLSKIAQKVTLIHRRSQLRALDYLQKQLSKKSNVEVIFNSIVSKIEGREVLEGIVIENLLEPKKYSLKVEGLFIAIGIRPATEIFKDLVSQDESGFIITDETMRTSCSFIWACGDCRKRPLRQLITAASEGAIASLSAYKYLRGHYISS